MAITFPLELPPGKFSSSDFDINRYEVESNTNKGALLAMEMADPYWFWNATVVPVNQSLFDQWHTFRMLLRGKAKRFYGYDTRRCYPAAYGGSVTSLIRHGGGAFNGVGSLVSASGDTVVVDTMPDGYLARIGDYLSIYTAGAPRALHKIMESAAGNNSGVLTVTVEPIIALAVAEDALVDFIRPKALMALTSWSAPRDAVNSPITFSAQQVLV